MVLKVTDEDDVEALAAQEKFSIDERDRNVILSVRTNGEPDECTIYHRYVQSYTEHTKLSILVSLTLQYRIVLTYGLLFF